MKDIDYGKRITHESFFEGKLRSTKVEYSISKLVTDKAQALSEIMKMLDLITARKTHQITIKVQADPKTFKFKLVTKDYLE